MSVATYLTHPEVNIDPNVPTPCWSLSNIGRERLQLAIGRGIFDHIELVIASSEQKALDAAEIICDRQDLPFLENSAFDENDRSSTGFLAADAFDTVATQFFEQPDKSVRGWETAIAAQNRIVDAVHKYLTQFEDKRVLFVGHGAVGTLLKCHIGKRQISRDEDQRLMAAKGGGNVFSFDWANRTLLTDWVSLEDWPSGQH